MSEQNKLVRLIEITQHCIVNGTQGSMTYRVFSCIYRLPAKEKKNQWANWHRKIMGHSVHQTSLTVASSQPSLAFSERLTQHIITEPAKGCRTDCWETWSVRLRRRASQRGSSSAVSTVLYRNSPCLFNNTRTPHLGLELYLLQVWSWRPRARWRSEIPKFERIKALG